MAQYGEIFVNEMAPELWDFSEAIVPPIEVEFPNFNVAMWNIAARQVFNIEFTPLGERVVRHYMRRIISAANSYEIARNCLADYFFNHRRDQPKLQAYFEALDSHETCIINSHIAVNAICKALDNQEANKILEDSKEISTLATTIRHFAGQSKSSSGGHNKTFPIFYRNDGITNGTLVLTFSDLHAFLSDGLKFVNEIVNYNASTA